jgi:fatty acid desaturase
VGRKDERLLWTVVIILVALWVLGVASAHTMGGLVHVLLVVVIVVVLVRLFQGRKIL